MKEVVFLQGSMKFRTMLLNDVTSPVVVRCCSVKGYSDEIYKITGTDEGGYAGLLVKTSPLVTYEEGSARGCSCKVIEED